VVITIEIWALRAGRCTHGLIITLPPIGGRFWLLIYSLTRVT
jgi:hypothetical protein